MTVMSVERRSEGMPELSLVGCWEEESCVASEEQLDERPPHSLDSEVESFWAGRSKAARHSARIAA